MAHTALWTLTDLELAAEVADALALRAQVDALLLARIAEADTRGLARSRGRVQPPTRIDLRRRPRINLTHRPMPPHRDWPSGASGGPAP